MEALAVLRDEERAFELYPLMREALDTGARLGFSFGLIEKIAGIAAAAAGEWSAAEEHFDAALREAEALPHRVEEAEVQRWLGRMLLTRNEPGDRERAMKVLTEARERYASLEMPQHVAIAEELLSRGGRSPAH